MNIFFKDYSDLKVWHVMARFPEIFQSVFQYLTKRMSAGVALDSHLPEVFPEICPSEPTGGIRQGESQRASGRIDELKQKKKRQASPLSCPVALPRPDDAGRPRNVPVGAHASN